MAGFLRRASTFSRKIMPPPDRWDAYCPMGKVIPGTKFLAFKVPLKEALLKGVKEEDRFSPSILVKQLEEKGLKLGGVIDLTFTLKYYNKEEFVKESIEHRKVFTAGHAVPSQDVFQKFAEAVKTFDDSGHIIGVHCTHGVNRTGYLICRYMIEELNMEPEEAIKLFNEARGHNLERENYLEDLKNRKKGESTYDPELANQAESSPQEEDITRRKPRWRHHKEDHPGWRSEMPNGDSYVEGKYASQNDLRPGEAVSHRDDRNWRDRDSRGHSESQHDRYRGRGRTEDHNWRDRDSRGLSESQHDRYRGRDRTDHNWRDRDSRGHSESQHDRYRGRGRTENNFQPQNSSGYWIDRTGDVSSHSQWDMRSRDDHNSNWGQWQEYQRPNQQWRNGYKRYNHRNQERRHEDNRYGDRRSRNYDDDSSNRGGNK